MVEEGATPPPSGLEDDKFELFEVKWITAPAGFSYFGCIATEDIPKHTLIHKERYTLQGQDIWTALEKYERGDHSTKEEDSRYLLEELGLTEQQSRRLWCLHDQRHDTPRLMGIVYSNGFSNSDLGREPCLFSGATSRFNHSCRPNVGMDFAGYDIRLFTTKSIMAGEELYLSYNEVVYYHSTAVRKAVLQFKYKFDCRCIACGSRDTTDSDDRRRQLGQIAYELAREVPGAHFLYDENFENGIDSIMIEDELHLHFNTSREDDPACKEEKQSQLERLMEFMSLLEQEQIDHDLLQCSELAYDIAIGLQGKINVDGFPFDASYWAKKTLALYRLHKGEEHTVTKTFLLKLNAHGYTDQVMP